MRLLAVIALVLCTSAAAQDREIAPPQYGGTLNIATVYATLSALSWDTADWAWKQNHDSGSVREQLMAGDLDKSVRKGGIYPFTTEAYLPDDALRGELAESWEWEKDTDGSFRMVFHLRQGVMFTAKPGVMKARELDAEDVVFSYTLANESPKKISSYFKHLDKVEARDRYTVVFHFNKFHAEWAYQFGYGYYSQIVPRETAEIDRKDWRNVVGTGPFTLSRYIQGNSQIYDKNPAYWDSERIVDQRYPIPFIDQLKYRIPDSTMIGPRAYLSYDQNELGFSLLAGGESVYLFNPTQYDSTEIPLLLKPIIENQADMVLGDRQVKKLEHMPAQKRIGNRLSSRVVSKLMGQKINDAQTGFRAFNRDALNKLHIFSGYTYTQETLLQAKYKGLKILEVPVTFRKRSDKSRLISNIFTYAFRTISLLASTIIFYKSFKFFAILSSILFAFGIVQSIYLVNHLLETGKIAPHYSLTVLTGIFLITGAISAIMAIISSILNRQSRLLEEINQKLREK